MEQRTRRIGSILVSLLLAILFALIFFTSNSPLGASIGSDNAMYLTMGTALAKGYAPYTQIFDHKGPLLFLLQMLPQAAAGGYSTAAVFVMEILFLFAGLRIMAVLSKECGLSCSIPMQIVYAVMLGRFAEGGNLAEEYTAPLTLLGILLCLKCFGGEREGFTVDGKALFLPALGLGALSALCLMERANNVLPLGAMVIVLTGSLLFGKHWRVLGRCAAGFAVGFAGICLAFAVWMVSCGALEASIYGAFIHNVLYTETDGLGRLQMLFRNPYGYMAMFLTACACLGGLSMLRKRSYALGIAMIAGAAAGGLAAFLSHKYYLHYLNIGVPMAATGIAVMLETLKKSNRKAANVLTATVLLAALGIGTWAGFAAQEQRLSDLEGMDQFARDASALYAEVPEEDRDHFMAYRVEPKWYVYAKALPCMRFYFLQEILGQADPAVMDEIADTFETDPPKWIVLFWNREFSPPYDERVAEIFRTRYEFVDAKGQYQLLRLRDGGEQ